MRTVIRKLTPSRRPPPPSSNHYNRSYDAVCLAPLPAGQELPAHYQYWNFQSRCRNMQFAARPASSCLGLAAWWLSGALYAATFGLVSFILVGLLFLLCCAACYLPRAADETRLSVVLTLSSVVASVLFATFLFILMSPFIVPLAIVALASNVVRRGLARAASAAVPAPLLNSVGGGAGGPLPPPPPSQTSLDAGGAGILITIA
jgi:hypothetical protein